jgi:hypothetical protein
VYDLSSSLSLRSQNTSWSIDALHKVVKSFLGQCRRENSPALGVWQRIRSAKGVEAAAAAASGSPGKRTGAGYCQVEEKLYIFGGLRGQLCPAGTNLDPVCNALSVIFGDKGADRPLNDVWCFDFPTRQWSRVAPAPGGTETPPPRAYCLLSHADGCLWMTGGRVSYSGSGATYSDTWRFSLSARRWTRIRVQMPHLDTHNAHVMYQGIWHIMESNKMLCFHTLSGSLKKAPQADGPVPDLTEVANSSWLLGPEMYVWTRPKGANDTSIPAGTLMPSVVWSVDLSRKKHKWVQISILEKIAGMEKFEGAETLIFGETCASVDESTGLVYLFGGWNDNLHWAGVDAVSGEMNLLSGRYSRVLLQLDCRLLRMRAVEPLSHVLGPSLRGQSALGAYRGEVVVAGGYTTLDSREQLYECVRCLSDTFMCSLQEKEEDSYTLDKLSLRHPNNVAMRVFNIGELLSNANAAVLHALPLRRRLTDAADPRLKGGFVLNVFDTTLAAPRSLDDVFKTLRFMSFREILDFFPNMQTVDLQTFNYIHELVPETHVLVVYYYMQVSTAVPNPALDEIPYVLKSAHYGRYREGSIYCQRSELEKGNIELSSNVKGVVSPDTLVQQDQMFQRCAYTHCPNLTMFMECCRDRRETPELKVCGKCKLVRYCRYVSFIYNILSITFIKIDNVVISILYYF